MRTKLLSAAALSVVLSAPFAMAQDTIVVPDTVTTYVTEQPMDETTVDADVTIGSTLPDKVVIKKVPDNDDFAYAVVNKQRVIVEPRTRKIIKIVQ